MKHTRLTKAAIMLSLLAAISCHGKRLPGIDMGKTSCSPISDADCFFPFPQNYYTVVDPALKTGVRLNITPNLMPKLMVENFPREYDLMGSINSSDGFSVMTPIVILLPGMPGKGSVPAGIEETILDQSPVKLVSFADGKPIPFRPQVYRDEKSGRIYLKLAVLKPMENSTRHAVIVTNGLRDESGKPLVFPGFEKAKSGALDWKTWKDIKALVETKLTFIKGADVSLAFDFTTRSEESATRDITEIRDEVIRMAKSNPPKAEISSVSKLRAMFETNVAVDIYGYFNSPDFRDKRGALNRNAAGMLEATGQERIKFQLKLPRSAGKMPAPVVVFGHGLMAMKESMIQVSERLAKAGFACIGIDAMYHWSRTVDGVTMLDFLDFDNLPYFRDGLLETVGSEIQLVRMVKSALKDLDIVPYSYIGHSGDGKPDLDTEKIFYIGQSMGAVLGGVFMAVEPDLTAGVLNVGGAGVSGLIADSWLFNQFGLGDVIPKSGDITESLMYQAIAQTGLLDQFDPGNFAKRIWKEPFPGQRKKGLLIQSGYHDGIVPNESTDMLARAAGVPLVAPVLSRPYGIEIVEPPVMEAGYFQIKFSDNPLSKVLAHIALFTPEAGEQIATFFSGYAREGLGAIADPYSVDLKRKFEKF